MGNNIFPFKKSTVKIEQAIFDLIRGHVLDCDVKRPFTQNRLSLNGKIHSCVDDKKTVSPFLYIPPDAQSGRRFSQHIRVGYFCAGRVGQKMGEGIRGTAEVHIIFPILYGIETDNIFPCSVHIPAGNIHLKKVVIGQVLLFARIKEKPVTCGRKSQDHGQEVKASSPSGFFQCIFTGAYLVNPYSYENNLPEVKLRLKKDTQTMLHYEIQLRSALDTGYPENSIVKYFFGNIFSTGVNNEVA